MIAPTANKWLLNLIAGLSLATFVLPQATLAQTTNADPLQDLRTQDGSSDPLSDSGSAATGGGAFDPFSIIHRSRLGNNRDMKEFLTEQRQSLDAEAAEFRKLQLQLLQQNPQPTPAVTPTESAE